jgi:diadenosine tetraphosphate (Ap4A) HIT family hydrolase
MEAPTVPHCHFCSRLHVLPESEIVWNFPHSVGILGSWQFYRGYSVLIARRHATELSGLSDSERRGYLDEMCLLARAIELCFRPHKLNCELLGNQVPHLHWHLFPRYLDDPDRLHPVWLALAKADHDPVVRRRLETGLQERNVTIAGLREQLQALNAPRV